MVILLSTCRLVSIRGSCSARSVLFFFFFVLVSLLVRLQLPPWFHGIQPVAVHQSLWLPVLSGSCSDVLETNGINCSRCTYWDAIGQFYLLLHLHGDVILAYFSRLSAAPPSVPRCLRERERANKCQGKAGRLTRGDLNLTTLYSERGNERGEETLVTHQFQCHLSGLEDGKQTNK